METCCIALSSSPSLHGSCPWKQAEVTKRLRASRPNAYTVPRYHTHSLTFIIAVTPLRTYVEGPNKQQTATRLQCLMPALPPAELDRRPAILPPPCAQSWGGGGRRLPCRGPKCCKVSSTAQVKQGTLPLTSKS